MKQGFIANVTQTAPDLSRLIAGFPKNGNAGTGEPPTQPGAEWFYMVSSELENLVKAAGLTPDFKNVNQVSSAVQTIIENKIGGIDYSTFVRTTGNQTVDGIKKFTAAQAAADQEYTLNDNTFMTAKLARGLFGLRSSPNTWSGVQTFSAMPILNIEAVKAGDIVNWQTLQAILAAGVKIPSGVISGYAGTTPPAGWLWCNGSLYSRTTYADLFAAVGTKWGAGDGSTTFGVPDSRNRTLWGANSASVVGQYLAAGLPNINGYLQAIHYATAYPGHSGAFTLEYASDTNRAYAAGDKSTSNGHITFTASNSNSIFGKSSGVQPAASQILMIIKT